MENHFLTGEQVNELNKIMPFAILISFIVGAAIISSPMFIKLAIHYYKKLKRKF